MVITSKSQHKIEKSKRKLKNFQLPFTLRGFEERISPFGEIIPIGCGSVWYKHMIIQNNFLFIYFLYINCELILKYFPLYREFKTVNNIIVKRKE